MADQPTTSKVASASYGRKASSKSANGRKAQQPSKAELEDLERQQKALERQVSQVEKKQAILDAHTLGSNRSMTHMPDLPAAQDMTGALSPERADQLSLTTTPPSFRDRPKGDPFTCSITTQDPYPQPAQITPDLKSLINP